MELIFEYQGTQCKKEFDKDCNCGDNKCNFFGKDCEILQEEGEIPMCLEFYGAKQNYYFVRVDND